MSYAVKEIFYTLQGEGAQAGRAAVFCRFAGCNLWSGRESDRASAICQFCDTQFVGVDGEGGGRFEIAEDLASAIAGKWPGRGTDGRRFVVCTGGEPLLQLDRVLIDALHERDFDVAVETNGTVEAPAGLDWICVSPKAGARAGAEDRRRAEAGFSAGEGAARASLRGWSSGTSSCSRWTGLSGLRIRIWRCGIAWSTPSGG